MDKIGERIRVKREHRSMHLNELAERVGVTKSCLSQIENGKSFPSIVTLKKIADSLGTTIGELVGEKERLAFNPLITEDNRKFVKTNPKGASLFLLSHHDPNKQMETYFVHYNPGADSEDLIDNQHGQSFCYIVDGELEIEINNRNYLLKHGDSFYYNSNDEHKIKNISNQTSKMIWIISHPNI
jgi:XRE family transcriptional regulator, regulator of sulfur utilization